MHKLQIKLFGIKGAKWTGYANSISVNAVDGRMTILFNHIDISCQLRQGEVLIDEQQNYIINNHGGFMHVKNNNVFIFVA